MARRLTELGLGARAALASPTTRLRTALTVLGVALGVCVLLIAASVPHAVGAREEREAATTPAYEGIGQIRRLNQTTNFDGTRIEESVVQAVAGGVPSRALPPGIARMPGPGEMFVSPAVAELLRGPGGAELRRRLHARAIGRIADSGLVEPGEALLYRGSDALRAAGAPLVRWHTEIPPSGEVLPFVTLLTIVLVIALLLPVALFVATAARFGAEERDRRLAAVRLVGADLGAVARIAAGEALLAALLGLLLGGLGFLLLRPTVAASNVAGAAVFPSDLRPSLALAVLIVVLVPAAAVAAALASIRGVAREPLGVARNALRSRRRLLWRLALPIAGLALLAPLTVVDTQIRSPASQVDAAVGVILALLGTIALLPWLVEAIARRAPDGSLSWLLAIRRLRLEGGTAPRVVGAIALVVAGAVALTVVFDAARSEFDATPLTPTEARTLTVDVHARTPAAGHAALVRLRRVDGVARLVGRVYPQGHQSEAVARVLLAPTSRRLVTRIDAGRGKGAGLHLTTPLDRLEDRAAAIDPIAQVTQAMAGTRRSRALDRLERALEAGGLVVLAMIGASLLIASAESLRERRAELADLAAVGTGRGTVARSLLWQAAIPVLGGLALGIGLGLALGLMLSAAVELRPVYDWAAVGLIAIAGLVVSLGVTGLTLPALGRAMRPPELRTD